MEKITLGGTGLQVSRIALGTWQLGGEWGAFDEREAIATIRRARELGINFFDTAQIYGWGASERLLGHALRHELDRDREQVVIATKGGLRPDDTPNSKADFLRSCVESSLRELGVDHIDLYQVHWPDRSTPFEEAAETLRQLVQEGKIAHVGVSNYDPAQMEAFSRVLPVETVQPPYNLFERGAEADVLPYARERNIGVLVYSPLASGLLSGAYDERTVFPEDDWRHESPLFTKEALRRNVAAVRELRGLAGERGVEVGQLAIAWTLAHPAVHVAIVGARRPPHIASAAQAAAIELGDPELEAIDEMMRDAA